MSMPTEFERLQAQMKVRPNAGVLHYYSPQTRVDNGLEGLRFRYRLKGRNDVFVGNLQERLNGTLVLKLATVDRTDGLSWGLYLPLEKMPCYHNLTRFIQEQHIQTLI